MTDSERVEMQKLKDNIQNLTDENKALNALRVELEEHIKNLNQVNTNLTNLHASMTKGIIMLLIMLGQQGGGEA